MLEVDCISIGEIDFVSTTPFTRNRKGSLVQKPAFTIVCDESPYYFYGRDVMWSFLDSLFPDDPLPRGVVEDDLYAPNEFSASMYSIFKDLVRESYDEGNDYLIVHHEENKVRMVMPMSSLLLGNDIEKVGSEFASLGCDVSYRPFKYRDKNSTHLRRAAYTHHNKCMIEVVDLGKRWYVRTVASCSKGLYVALSPPITIPKEGGLKMVLKEMYALSEMHLPWEVIPTKDAVKNSSSLLTREHDLLLYHRKVSGTY